MRLLCPTCPLAYVLASVANSPLQLEFVHQFCPQMAHLIKKSTGLTGLKVLRNPKEELSSAYNKIIKVLQELPDCSYKKYTLSQVHSRLQIVQNENDPTGIEKKIGCGQCEELLVQAENELSLARRFLVDKPWEPLISKPPQNQWKWPI